MNTPEQAPIESNWFDTMKLKMQEWLAHMNLSFERVSYAFLALAVGFLLGFFLKKFGRSLFFLLIGVFLLLFIFQYFGIATIHWDALKLQLGIAQLTDFKSFMQVLWNWITNNLLYVISGGIGFLVGYSVA